MSENKKINLASTTDLKNNCDDHLASVLNEFQQDFKIIDIKLVLMYISIALAGALFYLDKKFNNNFHDPLYYNLMVGLTIPFYIITGLVYLYSWKVEKNIKYVGVDAKKNKLVISTKLKKQYSPVYCISLEYNGKKLELDKHFTELYNKDGFLQLSVFRKVLTDQIILLTRLKE